MTLFQRDGRVRLRREAHEVMFPPCIVSTGQESGGSVMIFSCSGLELESLGDNKMKSFLNFNLDVELPQSGPSTEIK